jgi:hypothetical protein
MKPKTTRNTRSLVLGLFLAFGLLMFGVSQAAENEGIKVSKQFVDEMSKIDPSYKKLVKADATGTFVDYNNPATTKSLLEKAAANKKTNEVNKTSSKVEIAPTAVAKKSTSKSKPEINTNKELKSEVGVSIKGENSLGDVETRKQIDIRLTYAKSKLNSAAGKEVVRLKKIIDELEALRKETYNSKK